MSIKRISELYKQRLFNEALFEVEADLKHKDDCPYLWLLRGNLVQLASEPPTLTLEEAEKSYIKALTLDPDYIEAMESLAHFFDVVIPDRKRAHEYAQLALRRMERVTADMNEIVKDR
jgi:hypothetical protein